MLSKLLGSSRRFLLKKSLETPGEHKHKATMACPVEPPKLVRGMTEWDAEAFRKSCVLPCLSVKVENISSIKKALAKYTAKIANFKSLQEHDSGRKIVVLNPLLVKSFSDLSDISQQLYESQVEEGDYLEKEFELVADNWKPVEKLKYILPESQESVSGFSIIGHIIHLNLREGLHPYKYVIGKVLLETPNVRTVVAKTSEIDNTYRNFELEVLAGEKDFQVEVKENGCRYAFDFSKVYWNPRLSTEHGRIVNLLNAKSVLFDACAGVGPFSIPAARKCRVFANDLNPESYRWLTHNAEKNKIREGRMTCSNMDARDFLCQVLVPKLKLILASAKDDTRANGEEGMDSEWFPYGLESEVHVTMNLPALAITFINVFKGLLAECPELDVKELPLPTVHVYTFSKAEDTIADVRSRLDDNLGTELPNQDVKEIAFVRNVAPGKDMMRASFKVPRHILFNRTPKRKMAGVESSSLEDLSKKSKEHSVTELK